MKRAMAAIILSTALWTTSAPACPMCKDSVSDTAQTGDFTGRGGQQSLPGGFNTSIYYMLIGLFAASGLVIGVIVKGIRGTPAAPTLAASTKTESS